MNDGIDENSFGSEINEEFEFEIPDLDSRRIITRNRRVFPDGDELSTEFQQDTSQADGMLITKRDYVSPVTEDGVSVQNRAVRRCQLCKRDVSLHTICFNCLKRVCGSCWDNEKRVCADCATPRWRKLLRWLWWG